MNALVKILFLRICCCYEKIEKSGKVIDILFKMEWIKYTIYDPGDYSHLNVIILYVRKFYLKLSYSLYTITLIRDLQYNITTWVVGIFEWITRLLCHLPPRVRSTSGGKWQRRSVIHEKNTNHECRNVFTTWLLVKSKQNENSVATTKINLRGAPYRHNVPSPIFWRHKQTRKLPMYRKVILIFRNVNAEIKNYLSFSTKIMHHIVRL